MKSNLIILGSSGFIGQNIVDYFTNNSSYKVKGFSSQECNLLSMESISDNLSSVTAEDIIIFASSITRLRENTVESLIKNLMMSENLSKFIDKHGVGYLIFLSSVDVYGLVDPAIKISEQLLPDPNDYYALSKLASEFTLKRTCRVRNIPLLILRLSGIYGCGDNGKSTINKLAVSAIEKREVVLYGDGEEKRDFVYIDDFCHLIQEAIELKINKVINVASGVSCSIKEIVEIIRSYCGKDFTVIYRQKESLSEQRVKDMVYDISSLTSLFPDTRLRNAFEGIPLYLELYQQGKLK